MTTKLFGLCVALALPLFLASSVDLLAQERGLTRCPPRERGTPRPTNCYDPCPAGLVGEQPNCSCPPGTVLAERPRSPSEQCVKINSSPPIPLERAKKIPCPKGQIGTPPFNCHCPPGLTGPECNQPIVR